MFHAQKGNIYIYIDKEDTIYSIILISNADNQRGENCTPHVEVNLEMATRLSKVREHTTKVKVMLDQNLNLYIYIYIFV